MRADDPVTSLFSGGSEVGRAMADLDWSASPVGPPERWPAALRSIVRVVLTSRFSMWVGWGPELAFFYNDAYMRDTLRDKHPWAIGRPAREVWAEVWDDIGPRIRSVLDTGRATWDERLPLRLERAGYPEETYHTFSYSPLADDDGRTAGILCVVQEDTERVLGERRLRVLSELGELTAVRAPTVERAGAASIAVLAGDRQDVPFGALYLIDDPATSARLAASFGVRADPVLLPPLIERAGRPDSTVWRVLDTGRPSTAIELEDRHRALIEPLRSPVGESEPRLLVGLPLPGAGGGRPTGVLLAGISPFRALDDEYHRFLGLVASQISAALTDARTFQAQRRQAEELAELDRAKTEFFTGVSHELRTPLTLISGPADDALADPDHPPPPEQRARLELIARNAGRLRRLVDSMLEISAVEAGRLVPNPVPVDLAALTRGIAESFAPAVRRAGLAWDVDCPPLDTAVSVDADMWERIVLNLLSNAVKYTLTGRITLSVGRSADGSVALRVTDTGIGIPAQEQTRLFERFHRVRGATGRSHEGSGIGLSLVADLAGLHGGSVAVDSTPDVGSTFTVRLPASACTGSPPARRETGPARDTARAYRDEALQWSHGETDPAPTGPPAGGTGTPATVLVAEDNADLRRFIADRLRPHYRVLLAADGPAALELARAERPDLLLSDVMMPGLDGFQLLDRLRSDPDTATIPIILLSARAGPDAVGQGLATGADDYLVKPFSSDDLLARVRSNLALARLRGEEGAWRGALLNAITDGVVVMDADGTMVELNAAFADITGYGPEGLPYRVPHPWWPDPVTEPDDHALMLRAVKATLESETISGASRLQTVLRHRDGRRVWVETSTAALPPSLGAERRTVAVVRDVTEAHQAATRNRLLADTGRALTRPGELPDRLEQCARAATAVLDELVMVIESRPQGRRVITAAAHESRPDLVEAVLRCTPGRVPAAHESRYREGRALVLDPGPAELLGEGPAADTARGLLGEHSVLLAPLAAAGRLHGSLALVSVGHRRGVADEDLAMAEELGRRIAGALESERLARLEHWLHEASAALAAAATVREASAALADTVRESMDAAVALVYTPDPDDGTWLRLRHVGAPDPRPWAEFGAIRVGADVPAGEVARTNSAVWSGGRGDWRQRYPRLADVAALRDVQALVALPIGSGDQAGGVLVIGFDTPRTFPAEERRFVTALVAQAGQAFSRASRSDDRWRVSQILQDSLLPAALPTLDRLSLVAHYLPAGRDIHAGGDWYNVVALDRSRVAIMVGDVVGNGPVAAATMGKLSSALAAYLREGHGPAHALDLLSEYARDVPQALGSTAVCLVLDTGTGEVRGAAAGHPPPLLLDPRAPERAHYWEALRGVSLGVPGSPRRPEARTTLPPGASVLLYSDGLVERRRESIDDGLARLAAATAPRADAAPAELRVAALAGCLPEDGPSDDVALVIARYLPAPLQARIPARADQLGVVREQVRDWAAAVGLPEDSTYDLQLALGEALANAIEHGYRNRPGTVSYRLALTDTRDVRARVRDHGDWQTPAADRGFRGRGLELLHALAGEVTVNPAEEDGGTVVEFTMPWVPGPAAPVDPFD
jgi:PAS domain S-box-containing protein